MANIAILNYCNLQCPYCFANKFITEEEKEFITDEQLDNIFEFIGENPPGYRVGIIGGEPTIHPNFKNILRKTVDFCKEHNFMPPVVFSNGIKLGDFVEEFKEAHCLINVNSPEVMGEEKWKQLNKSLKRFEACGLLQPNISIGINLYPGMPDFTFILDLATKYRITGVRCSYVAPTCKFEDVDKDRYYTDAKPLFLAFIRAAHKQKITVNLDCNRIPDCYFSEAELEEIADCVGPDSKPAYCEPVIDISPDMKATACFGAYNLVDITKFKNETELSRYLMFKEMYRRNLKNDSGKCATCTKFENLSCQGGCLAFAKVDR